MTTKDIQEIEMNIHYHVEILSKIDESWRNLSNLVINFRK